MNSVLTQFIKNELDAYISTQRVHPNQDMVNLIIKAFEAYEEYKRLVSTPKAEPTGDLRWRRHHPNLPIVEPSKADPDWVKTEDAEGNFIKYIPIY